MGCAMVRVPSTNVAAPESLLMNAIVPERQTQDGICGTEDPCIGLADSDGDGICDNVDDCFGSLDLCGVCNGPGPIFTCGYCDIPEGDCDCSGINLMKTGIACLMRLTQMEMAFSIPLQAMRASMKVNCHFGIRTMNWSRLGNNAGSKRPFKRADLGMGLLFQVAMRLRTG